MCARVRVCVSVCLWLREFIHGIKRQSEREKKTGRQRHKELERGGEGQGKGVGERVDVAGVNAKELRCYHTYNGCVNARSYLHNS